MKEISKQLDKDLSEVFFNSIEEMNECLRKHLEKTLIGCEFIHQDNRTENPFRRFVHSVESKTLGVVITDQDGLSGYLGEQLFYLDDNSDPIPYKEWVKKINEQGVED